MMIFKIYMFQSPKTGKLERNKRVEDSFKDTMQDMFQSPKTGKLERNI